MEGVLILDYAGTGRIIYAARTEKALTQKQLADLLSVSDRTVSKWECGKGFPDPSLLEPLSDVLEIPMADLVRGERSSANASNEEIIRSAVRIWGKELRKKCAGIVKWFLVIAVLAVFVESLVFFLRTNGDGLRHREWVALFREQYEESCDAYLNRDVNRIQWISGDRFVVISDASAIREVLGYISNVELGKEHKNWSEESVTGYMLITADDGELPDSTFVHTFPAFTESAVIGAPEGRHFYYDATINGENAYAVLEDLVTKMLEEGKAECRKIGEE